MLYAFTNVHRYKLIWIYINVQVVHAVSQIWCVCILTYSSLLPHTCYFFHVNTCGCLTVYCQVVRLLGDFYSRGEMYYCVICFCAYVMYLLLLSKCCRSCLWIVSAIQVRLLLLLLLLHACIIVSKSYVQCPSFFDSRSPICPVYISRYYVFVMRSCCP